MASNMQKLVRKSKRQKFQRRRGAYRPLSEPAQGVREFNGVHDPRLKQYWAERVKTPHAIDRSQIPKDYAGYVNYRAHAKGLAWTDINTEQTPEDWRWLYSMFGATKFISDERKAALQLKKLIADKTKPELYFSVLKTDIQQVRVYFSTRKDLWWIMHIFGNVVKTSITYSDKTRAMSVYTDGTVRWSVIETFEFSSPP